MNKSEGRVVGCLGGLYEIALADGERLFCKARGAFRHEDTRVLVGDFVQLDSAPDGSMVIDQIAERKNYYKSGNAIIMSLKI